MIFVRVEDGKVSSIYDKFGSLLSAVVTGEDKEEIGDLISDKSMPTKICKEKVTAAANKIFSHISHSPFILMKI